MAKPPLGYRGPEGLPCGKSWDHSILVTGQLPGMEYGKQMTRIIPPAVSDLEGGVGKIGWDGPYQHERREKMLDRMEQIYETLRTSDAWLTPKEVRSIEWLLDQATAELDTARVIESQWATRGAGSFPLSLPDKLDAFPMAADIRDCTNPNDDLAPPGPHYGAEVKSILPGVNTRCPTRQEMQQRKKDREKIRQRFIDAAHHIRCAEFGVWRLQLYRRALEQWEASYASGTPGGYTTGPQKPPGGLTTKPPGPPPPKFPPDLKLPDPDTTPPVPPEGGDATTGPDAVSTGVSPSYAKKKRSSGASTAGKIVLASAAGLGLWAIAK